MRGVAGPWLALTVRVPQYPWASPLHAMVQDLSQAIGARGWSSALCQAYLSHTVEASPDVSGPLPTVQPHSPTGDCPTCRG